MPTPILPDFTVSGSALWQWRQQAISQAKALSPAPIASDATDPNWPRELDWLLQALTDLDALALRLETYRDRPQIPLQQPFAQLQALWQQRLEQRMPLQYLIGTTYWRQFQLKVTPAVLIPRPETEAMIDLALDWASTHLVEQSCGHWADLGTGSGAIALGLAQVFPTATVHAVDLSPAALQVAQVNAETHHLQARIRFYQGHWLHPLQVLQGQLQGILANPPYIPSALVPTLQPEVAQHEPHLALDGGKGGLDALHEIIHSAPHYLQPGGLLLVEIMAGQAAQVAQLFDTVGGYQAICIHADLAGVSRFVQGQYRG
jgi:release factor glutamine methyltransferase